MKKPPIVITLKELLEGDAQVVKKIYEELFPSVRNFIKKNNGTEDDAYEVMQEALFQVIMRARTRGLQVENNFSGYLFICCRNIWFNMLNKSKKTVRNDALIELRVEGDTSLENILFQERWDLFEEKMTLLSENCNSLLRSYFEKVSYEVIIKKYSYASKNVAFQRIHKCKKKLIELIKKDPKYKEL